MSLGTVIAQGVEATSDLTRGRRACGHSTSARRESNKRTWRTALDASAAIHDGDWAT